MTPRRPAQARPGNRPEPRPARRRRESAPSAMSAEETSTRSSRPQQSERTGGATDQSRPDHTLIRLGGVDGISVPARVLILVGAVLLAFIIVFPSLRGYLAQQAQYDSVVDQIATAQATATALESDLAKWDDKAYVEAQARKRLSYVMPGETTYVVVGADGTTTDGTSTSATSSSGRPTEPWYTALRESAQAAGESDADDTTGSTTATGVPTVPTAGPSASSRSVTVTPSASSAATSH